MTLEANELDAWNYSKHVELLKAYYQAVSQEDRDEGIGALHKTVLRKGQTLAGALDALTHCGEILKEQGFRDRFIDREARVSIAALQYIGILRCLLLSRTTWF